jgi:6-phosphogluconolactonase
LLATSFGGHVNATQKIDREGRLAATQAQVFKSGGTNPHSIVLDHTNRFVYVPHLGTDEIRIHKFDPQSAQPLSEQAEVVQVKAQSGPRHIVISNDNRFAYVLTEMTGQVLVFERNLQTGSLTLIQSAASQPDDTTLVPGRPRPPTGGNQVQAFDDSNMIFCAEMKLTPNGQFLFTSERTKSTLSTFKVDTQTGRIQRVAITPTEEMPRGFNVDPSGQYLVATGQKSEWVSLYSIDPQNGALNRIERVPGGQGANWVTFVKTSGQ